MLLLCCAVLHMGPLSNEESDYEDYRTQVVRRCPLLIVCRLMWFRVADLISMSNITVTHCIMSADDDEDDDEEENDHQDEAEEDADISSQDFELSESALSSQLSSSTQTQQLDAQDEPPEPVATTSGSATASEQQAAANMSSSHQQVVGQFDSAQTSRVGEQGLMPMASQSATGDSGLDFEVASASQPAAQDADPGEQKKKKPLGRPPKAKPAAEPKPKTPRKPGRPKV